MRIPGHHLFSYKHLENPSVILLRSQRYLWVGFHFCISTSVYSTQRQQLAGWLACLTWSKCRGHLILHLNYISAISNDVSWQSIKGAAHCSRLCSQLADRHTRTSCWRRTWTVIKDLLSSKVMVKSVSQGSNLTVDLRYSICNQTCDSLPLQHILE